ncbi:hypothetical protein [Pedobacter sp.]|uniref:hypothetical protein n=1 Tax=Pedobacter sp. TaxID=1411316 RepID=UPI003D800051
MIRNQHQFWQEMKVKIEYDGISVHLSMEAETSKIAGMVMLFLNLMGFALIIVGIVEWMLVLLILGILWLLFFGWLTLWNLFGREVITITTRSLNHQHHYGLYKTKLETKKINKALNISLIPAMEHWGENHYQLIFESFNDHNMPEEIYRSTLPISETHLQLLKHSIRKLYFKKVHPDYLKQPFMLN